MAESPDAFLDQLMDTGLYSIGATFHDRHPELVDAVIAQADAIERRGIVRYSEREGIPLEECLQTLVAGLAVRYYRAVAG